jgi:transcription antitermination factor NusG
MDDAVTMPIAEAQEISVAQGWHALWTRSHCEQLVHDQLHAKGFETFLPTLPTWSRRAGVKRLIPLPMFPSYLFVHDSMTKAAHVEMLKTRGVVRLLGANWDLLTPVADDEIEALRRIAGTEMTVMPHPYLHEGQRVRITHGPLSGVEGILVRTRPKQGMLVLSVDLLRQSVAVEIDCTAAAPVGN